MRSTISQLEAFLEGGVWADMVEELKEWEQDVRGGYPQCDTLKELGSVNGRLEALFHLLTLPHRLLEAAREAALVREEELAKGGMTETANEEEELENDE